MPTTPSLLSPTTVRSNSILSADKCSTPSALARQVRSRKELTGSPCGWPQDAIDAALVALHRSQNVNATLNGNALAVGQLDQGNITKTEFRVEKTNLSVQDRNALRALYQEVGIKAKGEELDARAPEFFSAVLKLASEAGGDAPAPARPSTTAIEDIQKLIGNERLAALRAKDAELKPTLQSGRICRTSSRSASLPGRRSNNWPCTPDLCPSRSKPSPSSGKTNRLLLAEPDLFAPNRALLAEILRKALNATHDDQHTA